MANLPVAVLSPIFFLHHCNAELSLWSAISPDVWVTSGVADDGGGFTTDGDFTQELQSIRTLAQ